MSNSKSGLVIGIFLVGIGVCGLIYKNFEWESQETVLKIGPIEATAEKSHEVAIPELASLGAILIGAGFVFFGLRK